MLNSNLNDEPNATELIAAALQEQAALLRRINSTSESLLEMMEKIHREATESRKIQNNIRLNSLSPVIDQLRHTVQSKQLSYLETLERIREEGLSFARFGDGELRMIVQPEFNARFQNNSPGLRLALEGVLKEPAPKLLVGMPNLFVDVHWGTVWAEIWNAIQPYLQQGQTFGNSHVSRPIFFQKHRHEASEAWARLFRGKSALIVTGKGSRFDMVKPLFSGLASYSMTYSCPTQAFEDLPRLMTEILSSQEELVLISLGPAGTVLAHLLALEGRQALDIGHLSASYNHALEGGAFPEAIPTVR